MAQPRQYTPAEGLQYAAALCARCEQCEYDIRRKLSLHGIRGADADAIIDKLVDQRFLDEERFARSYCRDKARFSGWGRIKIRASLQARGVSGFAVSRGLEAIDMEEYRAGLLSLARRLARQTGISDYPSRMKLMRRLASRGFEPDLAASAIDDIAAEGEV